MLISIMIEVKEQQSLNEENASKLQEIKDSRKNHLLAFFIDHWMEKTWMQLLPNQQIPDSQHDKTDVIFFFKQRTKMSKGQNLEKSLDEVFEFKPDSILFPML